MNIKAWSRRRLVLTVLFALMALGLGGVQFAPHAQAGPEIVGNPDGASVRALYAPQGGKVKRIEYFAAGVQTPVGINTPVASDPVCGLGGYTVFRADAYLVGTMTGTAPTLAIQWQTSIDGGAHWTNIGTFTTINATVTPASQSQVVSDVYNSTTAVAQGDCFRVLKTYGGSGSVGANVAIVGIAK
jgi:hypothetical protein